MSANERDNSPASPARATATTPARFASTCLLFAQALTGAACGSGSKHAGTGTASAATPLLTGEYEATGSGPVRQLTFYDPTHYSSLRSPCSADDADPCIERGTYAISSDARALSLTAVQRGETTTLPFQALETATDPTPASSQTRSALVRLAPTPTGSQTRSAADLSMQTGGGGDLIGGDAGALAAGGGIAAALENPIAVLRSFVWGQQTLVHANTPLLGCGPDTAGKCPAPGIDLCGGQDGVAGAKNSLYACGIDACLHRVQDCPNGCEVTGHGGHCTGLLPPLGVSANALTKGGAPFRLLGVNHSGAEYSCVNNQGFFDGPNDDDAITAMTSWNINAVRMLLNEQCWLGINGINPAYAGAAYQAAVVDYVNRLHKHGIYVILGLGWAAPGTTLANKSPPMPDADHAPAFWSSVATVFKNDMAVLYDIFNEPDNLDWPCWKNGCEMSGYGRAAGMQSLVDAVRKVGATQPLMLGGIDAADVVDHWLEYMPSDPAGALVVSTHHYPQTGWAWVVKCDSVHCWNTQLVPLAAKVPVVTGEIGEMDCAHGFIDQYMPFADKNGISYLGWTWNTWDCRGGPSLITDYHGTPTAFGIGLKNHLASLDPSQ